MERDAKGAAGRSARARADARAIGATGQSVLSYRRPPTLFAGGKQARGGRRVRRRSRGVARRDRCVRRGRSGRSPESRCGLGLSLRGKARSLVEAPRVIRLFQDQPYRNQNPGDHSGPLRRPFAPRSKTKRANHFFVTVRLSMCSHLRLFFQTGIVERFSATSA